MKIGLYRKVLLLFTSNDSEEVVLTGYDSSSGAQLWRHEQEKSVAVWNISMMRIKTNLIGFHILEIVYADL